MIRIAVYDDNAPLRETLALLFSATPDLCLVGLYANAMRVVETVVRDRPDVVLMDIDMPGRTGIEAVGLIRAQTTHPKLLMLTVFDDVERIFAALSAGAVGYLLKNTPADKLIDAIREVYNQGAVMTPSIALKVLEAFAKPTRPADPGPADAADTTPALNEKERQVLQRLVEGDSYKLIAHHLGISMGTVRWYIVHIYEKLHVNSKSEAVAKALRTGLF